MAPRTMIESFVSAASVRSPLGIAAVLALGLLSTGLEAQDQRPSGLADAIRNLGHETTGSESLQPDPFGLRRRQQPDLVRTDVRTDDETGVEWSGREWSAQGDQDDLENPQDGDYSPDSLYQRLHGEFIRTAFGYRPNLQFRYRYLSETDIDNDPNEFELNQYDANANFNVVLDPDVFLILGGRFQAFDYDFSGPTPQLTDETLYEVSGKIGAGWFVNDDLLIQGYYQPGWYSDLDGSLNSDDFQNFGRVLATYRFSDSFYAHAGLEVTAVFEDVPVYPLLGLTAILSEEWRLDILAPREAVIRYSPSPEWSFGAGLELDGNEFSYRSAARPGTGETFPSRQLDINTQEFRLFVDARYRATEQLSFYGRFGSVLAGDYNYRTARGVVPGDAPGMPTGSFNNFSGTTNPNLLFEVGVGFDF